MIEDQFLLYLEKTLIQSFQAFESFIFSLQESISENP